MTNKTEEKLDLIVYELLKNNSVTGSWLKNNGIRNFGRFVGMIKVMLGWDIEPTYYLI